MATRRQNEYSSGAAIGILVVSSTGLGTAHLIHEIIVTGPNTPLLAMLAASTLALTMGIALWAGWLGKMPQRAAVTRLDPMGVDNAIASALAERVDSALGDRL